MEVVSCKSCKEFISEQAESCPHCGNNPNQNITGKSKVRKVIYLLAAIVTAAVLFKVGLIPMF